MDFLAQVPDWERRILLRWRYSFQLSYAAGIAIYKCSSITCSSLFLLLSRSPRWLFHVRRMGHGCRRVAGRSQYRANDHSSRGKHRTAIQRRLGGFIAGSWLVFSIVVSFLCRCRPEHHHEAIHGRTASCDRRLRILRAPAGRRCPDSQCLPE